MVAVQLACGAQGMILCTGLAWERLGSVVWSQPCYLVVHIAPTVVVSHVSLALHQAVQESVVIVELQALLILNISPSSLV